MIQVIESAIKRLCKQIVPGPEGTSTKLNATDAMQIAQAVLNLANAAGVLKANGLVEEKGGEY